MPWYLILGNHDYKGEQGLQIGYHYIKDKDWRWNMPGYQWTRTFTTESGMTMQVVGIDVQRMLEYHFEHGRRQSGVRVVPRCCLSEHCTRAWRSDMQRCATSTDSVRGSSPASVLQPKHGRVLRVAGESVGVLNGRLADSHGA